MYPAKNGLLTSFTLPVHESASLCCTFLCVGHVDYVTGVTFFTSLDSVGDRFKYQETLLTRTALSDIQKEETLRNITKEQINII